MRKATRRCGCGFVGYEYNASARCRFHQVEWGYAAFKPRSETALAA
ncbi:hypothetical protein FTUN_8370 [Frigoriglobus tundricola]|uniref:Uncharacterized protein n=1 Tax=Frigoriglobus tundricola TaxID=2774151 RepID=A0A6M5Z2U3_9BACT|nr:hypothetical protein FTUN_8370 [Frigoriglobus tundricola]